MQLKPAVPKAWELLTRNIVVDADMTVTKVSIMYAHQTDRCLFVLC